MRASLVRGIHWFLAGAAGIAVALVVGRGQPLYADDALCSCSRLTSTWFVGGNYVQIFHNCLGASSLSTPPTCTATVVGQPCVVSGTLSWTPYGAPCIDQVTNNAVIGPYLNSNMALFYFDARTNATRPFAYATSINCNAQQGVLFGWELYVASTWSSGTEPYCICGAQPWADRLGYEIWLCAKDH